MNGSLRLLVRVSGFVLVAGSLVPYWFALRFLDRREFVSAVLAMTVGWFVSQSGAEFLRPDSAE